MVVPGRMVGGLVLVVLLVVVTLEEATEEVLELLPTPLLLAFAPALLAGETSDGVAMLATELVVESSPSSSSSPPAPAPPESSEL